MKRNDLYNLALDKYGVTAQQLMMVEESSELTKVILKGLRDGMNKAELIDEIADNEIMIEQMKQMYGIRDEVAARKKYKKRRLEKRV
jgi:NTP pyrophosphatase (non-canonical NTP hydrolase)